MIQTGAVLSSPPLFEVQAAQCEATVCAIGFLLRVCVCVDCAGHALMVGAPGREIAAVEEDRDKFSCNEEGDGHDKQCEVPSKHQAASSICRTLMWYIRDIIYSLSYYLYMCVVCVVVVMKTNCVSL